MQKKTKKTLPEGMKRCCQCGAVKSKQDFHQLETGQIRATCKECCRLNKIRYRRKKKLLQINRDEAFKKQKGSAVLVKLHQKCFIDLESCHNLQLAVLVQALKDYFYQGKCRTPLGCQKRARYWIFVSGEQRWVFSFLRICMDLEYDPEILRQSVRTMRENGEGLEKMKFKSIEMKKKNAA